MPLFQFMMILQGLKWQMEFIQELYRDYRGRKLEQKLRREYEENKLKNTLNK